MVWAESGTIDLSAGQAVRVQAGDEKLDGVVAVEPGALIGAAPHISGVVLSVAPQPEARAGVLDLPLASFPPLGSSLVGGIVTGLDPVRGRVTVTRDDGISEEVVIPVTGDAMTDG
jgi:hypothetical protein